MASRRKTLPLVGAAAAAAALLGSSTALGSGSGSGSGLSSTGFDGGLQLPLSGLLE